MEIRGNTQGNIVNCGYAAQDGDWIYYCSPNKKYIYKIKKDGSGETQLNCENSSFINIYDNMIYYTDSNCRIHRMRTDGKGKELFCDDSCWDVSIVDLYSRH